MIFRCLFGHEPGSLERETLVRSYRKPSVMRAETTCLSCGVHYLYQEKVSPLVARAMLNSWENKQEKKEENSTLPAPDAPALQPVEPSVDQLAPIVAELSALRAETQETQAAIALVQQTLSVIMQKTGIV
jgi:hypothetical protein